MKSAVIVAAAALAWACQTGKPGRSHNATYAKDVERICNAEQLSGAAKEDPNARSTMVAMWLGNNLVTPQARELMARQARLGPAEKAALLRAEAREVGLSGCPTADTWAPRE